MCAQAQQRIAKTGLSLVGAFFIFRCISIEGCHYQGNEHEQLPSTTWPFSKTIVKTALCLNRRQNVFETSVAYHEKFKTGQPDRSLRK